MAAPKKTEPIPVLIDTREQEGHAWEFDATLFTTEVATLVTGDYAIKGFESQISIERKTLGDAVSTVIHQFTRFRKELYRLAAMDHAAIVIEASIEDILLHKYESDADPLAVLGRLNSITIDHGIPVFYAGTKLTAVTFAERWLLQCFKKC